VALRRTKKKQHADILRFKVGGRVPWHVASIPWCPANA